MAKRSLEDPSDKSFKGRKKRRLDSRSSRKIAVGAERKKRRKVTAGVQRKKRRKVARTKRGRRDRAPVDLSDEEEAPPVRRPRVRRRLRPRGRRPPGHYREESSGSESEWTPDVPSGCESYGSAGTTSCESEQSDSDASVSEDEVSVSETEGSVSETETSGHEESESEVSESNGSMASEEESRSGWDSDDDGSDNDVNKSEGTCPAGSDSDDSAYWTPEKEVSRGGAGGGRRPPAVPKKLEFSPVKVQLYSELKYPWQLIGHLRDLLQLDDSIDNVLGLFQNWTISGPERWDHLTDCPCGKLGIRYVYTLTREVAETGQVVQVRVGSHCVDLFSEKAEQAEAGLHVLADTPLRARYLGLFTSDKAVRHEFRVYPDPGNLLFTREIVDFLRTVFDFVFIYYEDDTDTEWTVQVKIDGFNRYRKFDIEGEYIIHLTHNFYHMHFGSGVNLRVKEAKEC